MGTFAVPVEVGDPQGRRFLAVQALVDTGASYMVLPRDILADLGIDPVERRPFTLADGRTVEYEVGMVLLRLDGRAFAVLCVFGEEGTESLLGAVALETFGLAVDPVAQRLVAVPGRLMEACTNSPGFPKADVSAFGRVLGVSPNSSSLPLVY